MSDFDSIILSGTKRKGGKIKYNPLDSIYYQVILLIEWYN
jgi:hypothetical protein